MPIAVPSFGTCPCMASACSLVPLCPLNPASGSPPFCQGPARTVSIGLEPDHNPPVLSLLCLYLVTFCLCRALLLFYLSPGYGLSF